MATTTFQPYTGNGSNKTFNYSFPTYTASEVVVEVDGVVVDNYTIPGYQTTGTRTVTFDNSTGTLNTNLCESDGAPKNNLEVIVRRDTNIDTAKATYTAGSSLKAADLTNNNTQILRALQEEQNTPITTPRIRDAAITTAKIKADNITSALIADDQIDSEHYVAGSIDLEHMSANSVDSDQYVDGSIDEVHLSNSAVTSNKIAANAVTTTEILNGAVTRAKLEADAIDGTKLADNAVDSEHYTDGSIDRVHLEADIIDSTKLADNAVNSEHYVDGSIDHVHLANDIIDGDNIQDDVVNSEHIAAGALDNEHYAAGSITSDKLNGATVVTNSEQSGYSVNDTSFFTTSAAEARYFNASTGETIKDGDTFPDNDTTIATTAAINDRIIDLVDDVGGFVPIANETSFPNANPDVNNGTGTIVSISTLASNHTSNGSGTFTISNGTVGNSTVTINGAANNTTYSAGYGLLVETTTTLNTYTFHRLVPKATEVTTVAGKATEIGRLGTADAVADMAILGTADVVADLNTLGTADVVSDMNALAVSDVISDMNTLAVTDVINDMDTVAGAVTNVNNVGGSIANVNTTAGSIANVNTVAGSIANVNTVGGAISNVNSVGGSISNVNTVASNISNVNSFANTYRIGSTNPDTSLDVGDLFFNTTTDSLKVYTGSAWVDGVTQTGNFALKTGNTFTGDNTYTDAAKALFGTGGDLMLFHNGTTSYLDNNTGDLRINTASGEVQINKATSEYMARFKVDGAVELYYDNVLKLNTKSDGVLVSGELQATHIEATGSSTFSGDVYHGDNVKARFGAGSDLQIYHTADTASYITNTGLLNVNGTTGVHLQYNGTARVQTTSSGTSIQGASILNGAVTFMSSDASTAYHFNAGNGSAARFKASDHAVIAAGADSDLQIYHNGSNSYLKNSTGWLNILSDTVFLGNSADTEAYLKAVNNGSVELYYDHSKKFETTSGGFKVTGNIYGDDDAELRLGDSGDLQLYHNGSDSYINDTGTGSLILVTNTLKVKNSANTELMINATENGAVDLYHNNNLKISTQSYGASVTGTLTASGNIKLATDTGGFYAGAGDDLVITHTGSFGKIQNTANGGDLNLYADTNVGIYNAAGSETKALFATNGAVTLYHDNSAKFATTSSGISVTGDVIASGNIKTSADVSGSGGVIATGASDDLALWHGGTNSHIRNTANAGELRIRSHQTTLRNADDNETQALFHENASVQLYYDNVKRIETQSNGANIFGGLLLDQIDDIVGTPHNYLYGHNAQTSSQRGLTIQGSEASAEIVASDGGNHGGSLLIRGLNDGYAFVNDADNNRLQLFSFASNADNFYIHGTGQNLDRKDLCFVANQDGGVELYYDNSKKLEAQTQGIYVAGSLGVNRSGTPRAFNHSSSGVTGTQFEVDAGDSSNTTHETACFRGGADGNGAAARVRVCHGGDRGLVIEGGRTSNTAFGKIGLTDQNGDVTESVHINSSGTWFWGKTSQSSGTAGVELYKDGPNFMTRNGTTVLGLNCQNGTNGDIMRFYFQDVHKGSLNFSGGSFSATTASDYRLKENDTPITDAITKIKQLRPVRFNWKASYEDPTKTHDGFIAHELQAVMPDCVTGEKDGEITAKGEGYQAVSREGLIPVLTAALKDAISKIEILETKVAALEAA